MERVSDREAWDEIVLGLPDPHLLQSWEWGAFKEKYGWSPERWVWRSENGDPVAAAQVLFRTVGRSFRIAYSPRGPLVSWEQKDTWMHVLEDMVRESQPRGAIFIKIDPAVQPQSEAPEAASAGKAAFAGDIASEWQKAGWIPSDEQVQFRNTFTLDLSPSEDDLLSNMKQKTRYNIRLAGRRGVSVRKSGAADLDLLYRMYAETSLRDGFVIRTPVYYHDAWGSFFDAGLAQPFIAEVEGTPVAAIIVYRFGNRAYYMYGMSTQQHRNLMPNYLLQWEGIQWAKTAGCRVYDFWGAPDRIDPEVPMYGVYRFKEGFGAQFVQTRGAWDFPLRLFQYRIYSKAMPLILSLMRSRGMAQTRSRLA